MVVKLLHEKGLKAEHAYTAAFASTGLSVVSWIGSLKGEPAGYLLRIADTTAHVQQAARPGSESGLGVVAGGGGCPRRRIQPP